MPAKFRPMLAWCHLWPLSREESFWCYTCCNMHLALVFADAYAGPLKYYVITYNTANEGVLITYSNHDPHEKF